MNIPNEQLVARIAVLELLVTQILAISGANAANLEAWFNALRESATDRVDRLPDDCRPFACEALERVISSALETARQLSAQL